MLASTLLGLLLLAVGAALTLAGLVLYEVRSMPRRARPRLFDDVERIPSTPIGLVLGCAPRLKDGRTNLYFEGRMEATVALWRARKIELLVVSGDERDCHDRQCTAMLDRLLQAGLARDQLVVDPSGYRTLDSLLYVGRLAGTSSVTLISQRFHNERALYLASHLKLAAVGYCAPGPLRPALGLRVREQVARLRAVLDARMKKPSANPPPN